MKLAIFDIDGTLTCTNAIDEICFLKAAQTLVSQDINKIDPESFTHYTDENIVTELYRWHLQREATPAEKEIFKRYFIGLMEQNKLQSESDFRAVSGAAQILRSLGKEWQVALATGCWSASAVFKLNAAGIDISGIPMASSDEGISRHSIVEKAIEKALSAANQTAFEHIVYIGDGIWDAKTCARLGLPFVGIEAEGNKAKQARLGDFFLLNDYMMPARVLALLENAVVPKHFPIL